MKEHKPDVEKKDLDPYPTRHTNTDMRRTCERENWNFLNDNICTFR